jgi:cell division protein FtsW
MIIGRINVKKLFRYLSVLGIIAVFLLVVAGSSNKIARLATWKNRIENFMSDGSDENYQADMSKIAISTGGITGKGPGNSTQRNFLPQPYSDFIYAIIIEEYGLVGGVFILFLYLMFLYRVGKIVQRSKRTFQAFLAIGLGFSLVLQALTNMAVAVNLIPVTGQTLPFVSMGGTSIIFSSITFGIILSISRTLDEEEAAAKLEKQKS